MEDDRINCSIGIDRTPGRGLMRVKPLHHQHADVGTGLISLIYVSKATLGTVSTDTDLAALLNSARKHNAARAISGALIFTGAGFAQILEGEAEPVHELLDKILLDSRHSEVVVLREWFIDERLFEDWALAYAGPSAYVARVMAKPLAEALCGTSPDIGQLVRLLVQFAATGGTTRSAE